MMVDERERRTKSRDLKHLDESLVRGSSAAFASVVRRESRRLPLRPGVPFSIHCGRNPFFVLPFLSGARCARLMMMSERRAEHTSARHCYSLASGPRGARRDVCRSLSLSRQSRMLHARAGAARRRQLKCMEGKECICFLRANQTSEANAPCLRLCQRFLRNSVIMIIVCGRLYFCAFLAHFLSQ